jgi:hypothetical protein
MSNKYSYDSTPIVVKTEKTITLDESDSDDQVRTALSEMLVQLFNIQGTQENQEKQEGGNNGEN